MKTYRFIGSDTIGAYVARQLSDGWKAVESTDEADAVITYCMHASALEDAYFESQGIVKSSRKGAVLIDLSPSTPTLAREIAAVATVNGLQPVEAPLAVLDLSVENAFGSAGNFVCYASGEQADVQEARPVLDKLAGLVTYAGPSGAGQIAKAAHTMQLCAQLMAVIEGDALRRAVAAADVSRSVGVAEIDPLSDIAARFLEAVEAGRYEGAFTVEMMMADVVAASSAADDAGIVLPQLEAAMSLLEMLAVIGGADKSPIALSLLYHEEEACVEAGLDWKRAEGLVEGWHDHDHGDGHAHAHDYDDYDGYDDYDDDDYDDHFEFGGLGVYSER